MPPLMGRTLLASLLALVCASALEIDVLPEPEYPPFHGEIRMRANESTPEWPSFPTPPEGAPNVLLILIDDAGFGATSTFGGPIPTPNFDKVAERGLR
jgi:hypothetical protein